MEGSGGAAEESATTAFAVDLPTVAAGAAEDFAAAEEPGAPGGAAACPAAAGLHGMVACRGCSAARREGAAVVSERETGEVAGLRRSVKRKSKRHGDGGTTGDKAAIC
jgi:hypothetical protein